MHYHAAALLPVAGITLLLTTALRPALSTALGRDAPTEYLYALCAWVVLAAAYLFATYWTAMKSTMHANR